MLHPTRIVAVTNQKGGVGKTTTAINVAAACAEAGETVLLVDLDPQGNASTGLGLLPAGNGGGSYRLLIDGAPLAETTLHTAHANLSVVTSDPDLAGAEIELVGMPVREFRLRQALRQGLDTLPYSLVLLDCPPSLGLLTLNALVAADSVLIPLQCEFFALEGVSQLLRTLTRVRESLNPLSRVQGVVLTMYDRRNNLSELVAADARSFFGDQVYRTVIPRNVRISEAPSHGRSVLAYDRKSPGSHAYIQLSAEFLARETALRATAA